MDRQARESNDARRLELLKKRLDEGASFDELAALFRDLTRGRRHTPAEILPRESRDER